MLSVLQLASLVLLGEHLHDEQRNHVAADEHSSKGDDWLSQSLRGVEVVDWVALLLGVGLVHALEFQAIVFIQEESLVAVLEEGQVLELNQPDGDVVLVHEETSEQHEGDNQHGSQSHSQLLVREDRGDDKSVAASSAVNQNQNAHYTFG